MELFTLLQRGVFFRRSRKSALSKKPKSQQEFMDFLREHGHWGPFNNPEAFGTRERGIRIAKALFDKGWAFRQIVPTSPGRATHRYFASRDGCTAFSIPTRS